MAFTFPLASLLKYRELIESKELLSLQQLQQRAATLRQEIERLIKKHEDVVQQINKHLAAENLALHFRSAYEHAELLRSTRDEYQKLLAENERQQVEQLRRYQQCRTDRRLISEIRQRAEVVYRKDQDRREQGMLDDLFAARLVRGK